MDLIWKAIGKKRKVTHKTPHWIFLILEKTFSSRAVMIKESDCGKLEAMTAASNDNIYKYLADIVRKEGPIYLEPEDE